MIQFNEGGYVLVFTLFLLSIFTIIASTIFMLTNNEIAIVSKSIDKNNTVLAAESCIEKSIKWLKSNYSNENICTTKISGDDLFFGSQNSNGSKLNDSKVTFAYSCEINCLNEATENGIGLGVQIDMNNGYGQPRQVESGSVGSGSYYYKIKSTGTSSLNHSSTIEALVSLNY